MVDKVSCRGIIIDWDELFVVKLNQKDNYYCLPWGTLEEFEKIEDCIVREIFEELGVAPKLWNIIFIHELLFPNEIHIIEFFYKIENAKDYRNINISKASHLHEINDIQWMNINDDNNIKLLPDWLLKKLRDEKESTTSMTKIITSI